MMSEKLQKKKSPNFQIKNTYEKKHPFHSVWANKKQQRKGKDSLLPSHVNQQKMQIKSMNQLANIAFICQNVIWTRGIKWNAYQEHIETIALIPKYHNNVNQMLLHNIFFAPFKRLSSFFLNAKSILFWSAVKNENQIAQVERFLGVNFAEAP